MTPITLESPLATDIKSHFQDKILKMNDHRGDLTLLIDRADIQSVCTDVKNVDKFQFNQMIDLTAVDYLYHNRDVRFQMVYHLFSLSLLHRIRIKCDVPVDDATIDSIHDIWDAANWYERECYDMYGINFKNHPDQRRIIMYDEFEGHPLRKDYPITMEQPRVELRDIPERYNYMDKHLQ